MKYPYLQVEGGELDGRRYEVGPAGIQLGRSSTNDIHLPYGELSRAHCRFDRSGDEAISVSDLVSANGTYVNGRKIASDVKLAPGDLVEAGGIRIRVVSAPAAVAGGVDLGLSAEAAEVGEVPSGPKMQGSFRLFVWGVAAVVILGAVGFVLCDRAGLFGGKSAETPVEIAAVGEDGRIVEMEYEKVSADSKAIFRYYMTLSRDGTLKVVIDDVPAENRHVVKSKKLAPAVIARLEEILSDRELAKIDREYSGPESEPPVLESKELRVVHATRVKTIRVVNDKEPEAFARVREKLEAFSKNELGLWAIQYPKEKLIELAKASAETGRTKWEDREVEYGNVYASLKAYREALVYLETVNPPPPEAVVYRDAAKMAERELEARYREQRFKADKAINLKDWEAAQAELRILCELVPDRDDERNREASGKLIDVEKRLGGKGAK